MVSNNCNKGEKCNFQDINYTKKSICIVFLSKMSKRDKVSFGLGFIAINMFLWISNLYFHVMYHFFTSQFFKLSSVECVKKHVGKFVKNLMSRFIYFDTSELKINVAFSGYLVQICTI